jgi:tetratricopeptide (TPR) repeat protein
VSAGFLLMALLAAVPADLPDAEVAEQAETAFREGVRLRDDAAQARPHFARAAEGYEELLRRGRNNPLLYRNLTHAYLLAGDLPRAILTCRRGLRRAPGDGGLRSDLAAIRELVVFPPYSSLGRPPDDNRPPWWPSFKAGTLAALAAGFYALACLCLTRWLMVRRLGLVLTAGGCLAAAIALGVVAGIEASREREAIAHPLVVIAADGVLLRRGDGLTYPPRYDAPVNRGVEARLLFARGEWLQIELAGGEVGWVPRRLVLVDET